jgi:hypothetical protein
MDFAGFQAQRLRWAEGNLKIIRSINPMTCRGLTLPQRICYGASMYHWTVGSPKLIFYLAPPWILFTSSYPIVNFDATFLYVYGAFLASLVFSYKVLSRGRGRLVMDEVFNMATAFTLNQAVKRLIFGRGRPSTFVVTDKRGSKTRSYKEVLPHFALVAFSLLALEWAGLSLWFGVVDDRFGTAVSVFWVVYNLVLMSLVIEMALRSVPKRQTCRFTAALLVGLTGPSIAGEPAVGMTTNVSAGGCELLWPRPLSAGSIWPLSIALGGGTLKCHGEVIAAFRRRRGAWFAHGISFVGLSQDQINFLNDALFNMVVPRLFDHLSQPSLVARAWRMILKRFRAVYFARSRRSRANVPVRLEFAHVRLLTMMYDISATGFGVIVPSPMPVGAPVTMTVLGANPWSIDLSVARCQAMPASRPEFQTWLLGLRIEGTADASAVYKRVLQEAAA